MQSAIEQNFPVCVPVAPGDYVSILLGLSKET